MKAKVRMQNGEVVLALPASEAEEFIDGEAEILILGPGRMLVTKPGFVEEQLNKTQNIQTQSTRSALSAAETALVRKLMLIRYEERLVTPTLKKLSAAEAKTLDELVKRRVLTIFKSPKYKDGVYNIPQDVFRAASAQEGYGRQKEEAHRKEIEDAELETGAPKEKIKPAPAPVVAARSQDGSLPINSPAHLARFGYMVLDSENEARAVMEDVKSVQKNDAVKGVRGFDRRYYVLRKSFLSQYQVQLLAKLDAGDADADTLGAQVGLTPTAASVLLMILADEGEVLEKKKGMWGRA